MPNSFHDYERWKYVIIPYEYRNHILPRELMLDFDRIIIYLRNIENNKNIQLTYPELEAHCPREDNPHKVNKEQLELNNVKNVLQVSLEDFKNHIKENNPHNITKDTVELNLLKNFSPSTIDDVDNRTEDTYMTAEQLNYYIELYKQTLGKTKRLIFGIYPEDATLEFKKDKIIYNDIEYEIDENTDYEYKAYMNGYFDSVGIANIDKPKAINIRLHELISPKETPYSSFISISNSSANGLRPEGNIRTWGSDTFNEVRDSAPGTRYEQVFSGDNFSIAITKNGNLYGWGDDSKGCISQIPQNIKFKMISIHKSTVMGLTDKGRIRYWGEVPNILETNMPEDIFTYISCGEKHSSAINIEGKLISWGDSTKNQTSYPSGDNFIRVSCGTNHSIALTDDGEIRGWGDNSKNQIDNIPTSKGNLNIFSNNDTSGYIDPLGEIRFLKPTEPLNIIKPKEKSYIQVKIRNGTGIGLRADGTINTWGNDSNRIVSRSPKNIIFKSL